MTPPVRASFIHWTDLFASQAASLTSTRAVPRNFLFSHCQPTCSERHQAVSTTRAETRDTNRRRPDRLVRIPFRLRPPLHGVPVLERYGRLRLGPNRGLILDSKEHARLGWGANTQYRTREQNARQPARRRVISSVFNTANDKGLEPMGKKTATHDDRPKSFTTIYHQLPENRTAARIFLQLSQHLSCR